MRRALFLIIIVLILIGSGFLSIQLSQQAGGAALPGLRVQTDNPEASALVTTPQKGALFLAFVFVLINLIGGTATVLALIFWFLNRQVAVVKTEPNRGFEFSLATGKPNSLGGVLTRYPAITIGIVLILVVGAALTAALLGFFTPR